MVSEEHTCYRIYDTVENQEIVRAETIQDLFQRFLNRLGEHNLGEPKIDGFKDEATFFDADTSFLREDLKVEKGLLEKEMVFDEWANQFTVSTALTAKPK